MIKTIVAYSTSRLISMRHRTCLHSYLPLDVPCNERAGTVQRACREDSVQIEIWQRRSNLFAWWKRHVTRLDAVDAAFDRWILLMTTRSARRERWRWRNEVKGNDAFWSSANPATAASNRYVSVCTACDKTPCPSFAHCANCMSSHNIARWILAVWLRVDCKHRDWLWRRRRLNGQTALNVSTYE